MTKEVPHIWHTVAWETDKDANRFDYECWHLAMCEEGAFQAFLLHHGMMYFNGVWETKSEGPVSHDTDRSKICFDPLCVLYGLSFGKEEC